MKSCARFAFALIIACTPWRSILASTGGDAPPVVQVEIIDTAAAWASPCWGYNAPKILRNQNGDMWAVDFFGKYGGHEHARILKRTSGGQWLKGDKWPFEKFLVSNKYVPGAQITKKVQEIQYS